MAGSVPVSTSPSPSPLPAPPPLQQICFSIATQTAAAAIFTLVGAAQMAQWAAAKHRRLIKTFDGREGRDKYPRRWVMLPPFF